MINRAWNWSARFKLNQCLKIIHIHMIKSYYRCCCINQPVIFSHCVHLTTPIPCHAESLLWSWRYCPFTWSQWWSVFYSCWAYVHVHNIISLVMIDCQKYMYPWMFSKLHVCHNQWMPKKTYKCTCTYMYMYVHVHVHVHVHWAKI